MTLFLWTYIGGIGYGLILGVLSQFPPPETHDKFETKFLIAMAIVMVFMFPIWFIYDIGRKIGKILGTP